MGYTKLNNNDIINILNRSQHGLSLETRILNMMNKTIKSKKNNLYCIWNIQSSPTITCYI